VTISIIIIDSGSVRIEKPTRKSPAVSHVQATDSSERSSGERPSE
jgi:hypothetical protein